MLHLTVSTLLVTQLLICNIGSPLSVLSFYILSLTSLSRVYKQRLITQTINIKTFVPYKNINYFGLQKLVLVKCLTNILAISLLCSTMVLNLYKLTFIENEKIALMYGVIPRAQCSQLNCK